MLRRSFILAFAFLLGACAAPGVREAVLNQTLPRQHELSSTPFYPQTQYHCGPAALATALNAVDVKVTPDQLAPEVYIPSRKGSLQVEMLTAARRHGTLAVRIEPRLDAMLQEIATGNVVVVMQNLGLSWYPAWHYAVVVGYDLDKELIWLRSGTYKRFEMTLNAFERTWARSDHWAFVALKPGDLPASAGMVAVSNALTAFEKTADARSAHIAYLAAARRWPDNLVLLTGVGTTAFASGDLTGAASAFRQAIAAHPDSPAAYNNLANVLLAQNLVPEAKLAAEKAMQLSAKDSSLRLYIQSTLDEISAHEAKNRH